MGPWRPWGRPDEATLAELQALGLTGIEVDHQDHDADARDRLRSIAQNLGLVVTGASDYHGDGVDHDLGCNTTHPDELARLLEVADRTAAASAASPRRS